MQGYIKLYRELLCKPIWKCSTPIQKTILVTLLLMANHRQQEWEWQCRKFKVDAGQFVTSLENISQKTGKGVSVQNVRTTLKKFEKLGFLTNKSTKTGRLITIVNWESYQSVEINQQRNQQSANKEITSNNNERNIKRKNIKQSEVSQHSTMPEKQQYTEHQKKCLELGLPFDAVIND